MSSFRELIEGTLTTDAKGVGKTTGQLNLLASYLEQHPMKPRDVATLLTVAAGAAMRQTDPTRMLLLVALVRSTINNHPLVKEIDEALNQLMSPP